MGRCRRRDKRINRQKILRGRMMTWCWDRLKSTKGRLPKTTGTSTTRSSKRRGCVSSSSSKCGRNGGRRRKIVQFTSRI